MAGGEDEAGSGALDKHPVFPPYSGPSPPHHSSLYNHLSLMDHKPTPYLDTSVKSRSVDAPVVRSDPPATTADEPVTLPSAQDDEDDEDGQSFGDQMSEVLAKVGQEELTKTGPADKSAVLAENLSTDPNMPVFIKRKRGRPRKHPLPEQRPREIVPGRRVGRPPKTANRMPRIIQRRIKKEPLDEPLLVEQLLEEQLADHLPTQQSLATESDRDETAIRFTDVGNHLPLLMTGRHLCAVCLTRHSYRQTSGMRRTRATSFKRFTSVVCRTCNKFLCVAPRADGRTCFEIYHTMKDFICADLPEFNRKDTGDADVISAEFDDSADLTEDANMLLQLLQVASGEISKLSDLDGPTDKEPEGSSPESVCAENSQDMGELSDGSVNKLQNAISNSDANEHGLPDSHREETERVADGGDGATKTKKNKDVQSQAQPLSLLLKVLSRYGRTGSKLKHLLTKFTAAERTIKSKPKPSTAMLARRPRKITPKKHMYVDEPPSSGPDDATIDNDNDQDNENANDSNDNNYAKANSKATPEQSKGPPSVIRVPFRRKPGRPSKSPLKAASHRKRHGCNDCNVTFWTPARLQEHQRIHTGERPYGCEHCDMKFMRATHLKKHQRMHVTVRTFLCNDCGKTFANNACLKEHMYTHTGEHPHKCPKCVQCFTRKQSLAEHLRMHTGERPFSCKQCDSRFTRKAQLRAHMLFHTGEKPFLCQTCGSKFRFKAAFNEHVRIHTGSKPFICPHCGTAFTGRTTLKRHVRLHTGEKPYKCSVCGLGFVQRTSLMCHIKKHPGLTLPSNHAAERIPKGKGADVCLYPVVGRKKRNTHGPQGPPPQQQPLVETAPGPVQPPAINSHMELLMSEPHNMPQQTNSMQTMHMDDTSTISNEAPQQHQQQQHNTDNSNAHNHHHPQGDAHLRMPTDHTSHLPMSSAAWSHDLPTQVPPFSAYDPNSIHRSHQMPAQPFAGFLPMHSQMPPTFPDQQRFPLDYRFSMN